MEPSPSNSKSSNFPKPPSHSTFKFQKVTISSQFDSGNCNKAQIVRNNHYSIWIGSDHPKNDYRTWFHFSIDGIQEGSTVTFTIKNMQNQSKMLKEGLVPVWREQKQTESYSYQKSLEWQRISHKINTNEIEFNQRSISWNFKHSFISSKKHYFAFFYPWSNEDNHLFLASMQKIISNLQNIYFYRGSIIKTLENRPVQFLVISSNKAKIPNKTLKIQDEHLFPDNEKKPSIFAQSKPIIFISARVHPGQVPGSHVMTGIINQLLSQSKSAEILRDNFVFYIFPIINPDGVARGHYRVDTNGINLNRCYLNPNPKTEPSIYAIKKTIMHANSQQKMFAYLDLHAHATRRGTFIYGNCTNQLIKQTKTCLFPKLLSLNSADFEYQGSNFTEQNMYNKDRGDHISKEGSGRVAIFKATKNPYCWTLQCNYNISKVNNILCQKRNQDDVFEKSSNYDSAIVTQPWNPPQTPAKQYFTVETFRKLGRQICETFLDLIQKNPESRINNSNSYFKNINNIKMHLGLSLMKMAPNRFQNSFKKIFYGITNSENQELISNSLSALYHLLVAGNSISNIYNFLKTGDSKQIIIHMDKHKKISTNKSKDIKYKTLVDYHKKYRNLKMKKQKQQDCNEQNNIKNDKISGYQSKLSDENQLENHSLTDDMNQKYSFPVNAIAVNKNNTIESKDNETQFEKQLQRKIQNKGSIIKIEYLQQPILQIQEHQSKRISKSKTKPNNQSFRISQYSSGITNINNLGLKTVRKNQANKFSISNMRYSNKDSQKNNKSDGNRFVVSRLKNLHQCDTIKTQSNGIFMHKNMMYGLQKGWKQKLTRLKDKCSNNQQELI